MGILSKIFEVHYRDAVYGKFNKLGIFNDLESAKQYAEIYGETTLPICLYVDELHLGDRVYYSKRTHVKEIIYAGAEWEIHGPIMWRFR